MSSGLIEQLFSLKGRVAIVAGGSRGIGAAIAAGYAAAGATVIAVGRSLETSGFGGEYRYQQCDVADADAFRALCGECFDSHGRLDILVNAAAITRPSNGGRQIAADFDATIAVGLRAAFTSSMAASDYMVRSGGGSIINVTSIGSVLGFPNNPAYGAAKGGLRILSKSLAMDLGKHDIRVNNLAPGYIRTEMTEASYADDIRRQQRQKHTILDRWGTTDDLIGAAIFLAAPASAYVTGQDVFVDGGWTAKGLI